MRKKQISFLHLSRRKRKELYVKLRWRIRHTAPRYGGMFTSYQLLDELDRPSIYNQWADVYFCGSDGLTIWNADILTTTAAFWNKTEEDAHARAWEMLTPAERGQEATMEVKPVWHGGRKYFQVLGREQVRYEKFGGLTLLEYQDRLAEEIIRTEPPQVFEEFITDKTYSHGIGLHMVIHVAEINVSTIEQAIERFRAVNGSDWRADSPVSRSELPTDSRKAACRRYSSR
jgi:hypothetical protein